MTAERRSGKIKMFGQLYLKEAIDIKTAKAIAQSPIAISSPSSRSAKFLNKQAIAAKIQDFF